MLRALKDWFDSLAPVQPGAPAPAAPEHQLQLATAVLLVEVMRADATLAESERHAVAAALVSRFALGDDEARQLMELADRTSREAGDFFAFTSRLNSVLDDAQKAHIVELMWSVAYADGHLAAHELHVMRRLADLLYVSHGAYIGAKLRAKQAAGVVD